MSPAPLLLALSLSIGPPGTPPDRWLAEDKPEASRPKLPVEEKGGRYGE